MRLRDYNGAVKDVVEVVPAIEERRTFNGTKRRRIEPCKDASVKPNALVFTFKNSNTGSMPFGMGMGSDQNMLVGNLKAETAEQILTDLTEKGYADISVLSYQETKTFTVPEQYKLDNGVSGAYYYTGWGIFQTPGAVGAVGAFQPIVDDESEEDLSDEQDSVFNGNDISKLNDENLRAVLYDWGDYTFLQLGQMGREKLEEEYERLGVEP